MTAIDRMIAVGATMDTTGLEASGGADHKAGDSMNNKLETTRADSEPGDCHEGDRQDERDDATRLKASGGADHKDSGKMDNKLETPRADSEPPVFRVFCVAQLYERTAEELFKKCAEVGVTVKAGRSSFRGGLINLLRPLCVEGWRRWRAQGKPSNEYLF